MTATVYELIGFALVRLADDCRKVDQFAAETAEKIREDRNAQYDRTYLHVKRSEIDRTQGVIRRLADALNDDPVEPDGRTSLTRLDDLRDELTTEAQRWAGAPGWRSEWAL